jgi:alpha-glucosidase (family GH31 glycosyl hydrolase)
MARAAQLNTSQTAAYWCGDTGGYNGDPSDELYIRWLQYSTFTPCQEFFSAKGTKGRFPWAFGPLAQQIFQQYSQLRYRLLPFRYSNAQIAYHETPVKYPVRFVSTIAHAQIIAGNGPSEILVQPVTTAGATSAQVNLPSDASWIDYWTGDVYEGGASPTVSAPLDRVPMFVKAGSIIPMGPAVHWVDEVPADPLTIDIYPSGATSYTLYEDDGATDAYLDGAFTTTALTADNTGGPLVVVSIGAAIGTYSGQLSARTYVLKINQQPSAPGAVARDGNTMTRYASQSEFDAAPEGWFQDERGNITWVKFRIQTSSATRVALY